MSSTVELEASGSDSLSNALRVSANTDPDRVAFRFLVDGEERVETLTFGQLHRRACAVAARLQGSFAAGSRVLVACPPGLDYIVSLFGCFHAGMIAVPAFPPQDMHRAAERLDTILERADIAAALGTAVVHAMVAQAAQPGGRLAQLEWHVAGVTRADEADADLWKPPVDNPHRVALLQFTSGSTLAPRGVMLSHQNLASNCRDIAWRTRATADTRVVSWLPPYHDMGLIGCLLTPALIGAEATLMSPLSFLEKPSRWLRAVSNYQAQISGAPDFAYALCARRLTDEDCAGLDLHAWRVAFNGAERVHARTIRDFAARFGPSGFSEAAMRPCYGLAEATLCVTLGADYRAPTPERFDADALKQRVVRVAGPEDHGVELVGCGTPMPDHRLRIVEPGTSRALSPDRVGEVWVSGPSVGAGIFGDPALSRSTFSAELLLSDGRRYLRTGDLGFMHEGELYVVARLKDLIIIRGRNYAPDDIEAAVAHAHPSLRLGATVAFMVEAAEEERLVVVQELRDEAEDDTETVARAIREAVARALQLPVYDIVLARRRTIPRTSSGKVQRQRTKSLYCAGALAGTAVALRTTGAFPRASGTFAAAGDDLEATVRRVMARFLEQSSVGLDDDFFALGGHSLLATRVMSHLRESLSVDLPLRLIFDAPTARRLAAGVRSVQRHLSIPEMPRIDRDASLPLSYSQERMMFLHLLRPESSAYNIAGAMQLDGPLDVDAVDAAIADLLERHEILSARYRFTAEGPEQTLHPGTRIDVERVDFTAAFDPANASDEAATELAVIPFDLEAGPLLRVALHRLGPDLHRLVFCVHHIVADGWSLEVGLQDFIALYAARRTGVPSELEPLPTQYVDYAAWQRSFLDSEQIADQEAYWRERLLGAPRFLPLPTDRPRPNQQHHDGDVVQIGMTAALVDAATALAREHGATLFMVMLAAFNVVLSRYSGSVDICVGTPIANRNWRAAEGLVGTFVNTLVMRTDCSGDPAFLELIARVREVCLGAYDNQDVPFERLVDTLQTERDMSHSPLFQVFFDFQNLRLPPGAIADLSFSPIPVRRYASQFDLSFGFLDFGGGMLGSVEFRTDIFDRTTIERMAEHLMRVLEGAVADPAAPISRLPMFSDDERHALLVAPNETAVIFEDARPVHAGIGDIDPSRVALVHGETSVTYGVLEVSMNQLAHHLRALGVQPNATVGVLVERGPSLVVAMLAAMQAGGAYIPMDPSYPPARLNAMLEDGRPTVIVTEHSLASRLPPVEVPVVFLDDDAAGIASHPPTAPSTNLRPEDLAYVIFTSGSTGRPKGVMVPHRALTNFLCSMAERPGCAPDERLLSVTTVSFDIAALELLLPLLVGATVDIASRELAVDAPRLAEHIRRTRPSMMQATPATWRMLLEAGWEGDPELRVLCGGEALPRDLATSLRERVGTLWNMYGPTETTIWSSAHPVGAAEGPVPLGEPIANTQMYVLDPNGGPVPHGTIGELYIGGEGVANGYIGRDDLTVKRFVDDPFTDRGRKLYRTGDATRRTRDGVLHFEGRLDNQVKVRGFRIELAEIETQLRAHPFVADAACHVWPRADDNVELVAYLVCRPTVPEFADLRRHLAGLVPDYMVPSAYLALDEFPRTANGKLDRGALPDPRDAEVPRADKRGPTTPLQARLVALWQEILGTPEVGIDDDFFELGGHSLLAVRLFVRIADTEGVSIPLGLLFEAATIRALARHIEAQ